MNITTTLTNATNTNWTETADGLVRLWETTHNGQRKIVNYNPQTCLYTYATGNPDSDYVGFSTTFDMISQVVEAVK